MKGRITGQLKRMFGEAAASGPGSQAVLERMADTLLLLIIGWGICRNDADVGLFAALADRQLGSLLQAILGAPERAWTIGSMAALSNMSRSAFVPRFQQLLGATPSTFLLDWRMRTARRTLREGRLTTQTISEKTGYASEAAFAKAFKRDEGVGPGA